jgi:hypothetical protein
MTHKSTEEPEPRSFVIPAKIDLTTSILADSMVMFSVYPVSNVEIAAREPLPMAA